MPNGNDAAENGYGLLFILYRATIRQSTIPPPKRITIITRGLVEGKVNCQMVKPTITRPTTIANRGAIENLFSSIVFDFLMI